MKLLRGCFVKSFTAFTLESGLKWDVTITTTHISKGQKESVRSKYFQIDPFKEKYRQDIKKEFWLKYSNGGWGAGEFDHVVLPPREN